MTCSKHPTYRGIHRPRVACRGCWDTWHSRQGPAIQDAIAEADHEDRIGRPRYRRVRVSEEL